nr:MAG: capsid protein [Cressdnaviricota sp.]
MYSQTKFVRPLGAYSTWTNAQKNAMQRQIQTGRALARASIVPLGVRARRTIALRTPHTSSNEIKIFDNILSVNPSTLPLGSTLTTLEPTAWNNLGGLCELNAMQQGATAHDRIGNKVVVTGIDVRCSVIGGSALQPACNLVRFLIIYDKQPNGAFPTFGDILQRSANGGGSTFASGPNVSNLSRFKILSDKTKCLTLGGTYTIPYRTSISGLKLDVEYRTSTGAIGDITTGAIYFMIFNDGGGNAVTTTAPALFGFASRIKYMD